MSRKILSHHSTAAMVFLACVQDDYTKQHRNIFQTSDLCMFVKRRQFRGEDPAPIDLKIDIMNFGPVSKGSVRLKPLTIFVGPNNSGKSYVTMLIHSILTVENKTSRFMPNFVGNPGIFKPYGLRNSSLSKMYNLFSSDIQEIVKQNKGKESFEIPAEITKKIFREIVRNQFNKNLESEIQRNFGTQAVSELARAKQKRAKIRVSNSKRFDISINKKLTVKADPKFDTSLNVEISKEQGRAVDLKTKDGRQIMRVSEFSGEKAIAPDMTLEIIHFMQERIRHNTIPEYSFYFPAGRSGILQGHKSLSASIISNAQFGGIESIQVPKLTGVVSDFIANVILMPDRHGQFFKLARQLEAELLHGHIELQYGEKGTWPEIIYQSKQNRIPLHRASSTISEIAPLSLYLKHLIPPSSLLIIEEPEAHMHPANQLVFAKYIVRMIRSGLNVLITTHSVFLLECLGKFMLASKVKPEIREKKLNFGHNDVLQPDEVAPYVFVRKDDNDHEIQLIEINDEEGIPQDEFIRVSDVLYSKSIILHDHISENQ